MSLPILHTLHQDITRLYIAGSSLAVGDPRLRNHIPQLQKLGEKAPVFAALAERLAALTQGDDKTSPEALMEVGVLLYSLRYTQGTTETGGESQEMVYAEKPLPMPKMPHSRLKELRELLFEGAQKGAEPLKAAFEAGQCGDPRLFDAYGAAITDTDRRFASDDRISVSSFVEEVIIPAIGRDMIPMLKKELDLKGSKRHARLFKILYGLMGKDALPLAEKALAEGSEPVMVEAIRVLGEDPKYEETLLAYTKDRKSEVKAAAFAALAKMESEQGGAALLAALEKTNIGFLEDALVISPKGEHAKALLETAELLIPSYKDHAPKLKTLLRALARRDEEAGLALLERIIAEWLNPKGNTLKDANLYHTLDLHQVLQILFDGDTKSKNEAVYRICEQAGEAWLHFKMQTAIRLFPPEEVYDRCVKDILKHKNYGVLLQAYGISYGYDDPPEQKAWDRRWAAALVDAKHKNMYLSGIVYTMVYDDDEATWTKLLFRLLSELKTNKHWDWITYRDALSKAFALKNPRAEWFYEEFIKAGVPKEELPRDALGLPPAEA